MRTIFANLKLSKSFRRTTACMGALLMLASTNPAAAADEKSEGTSILVLEKTIRLKDFPSTMMWAPDARQLALKGFNDGTLRILDVDTSDGGADRVIAAQIRDASLAWSPDGQTIAVNQPGGGVALLRLFSVADSRETARREITDRQVYRICPHQTSPMAFADQGRSLWVACTITNASEPFTAALKLNVPDLSDNDRLLITPPVSGENAQSGRYSFARVGGKLTLAALVGSITDVFVRPGFRKVRFFGRGIDPETKKDLFPQFELVDDERSGFFRGPDELMLFPDVNFALVRMSAGVSQFPGVPHDERFDRLFEGYDTRTGKRVVAYGGNADHRPESGVIGTIAQLPDGALIVGRWSRADTGQGGLVVLAAQSGTVIQRISFGRTSQMALSADGRRVATITYDRELRIYRVRQ
jgi:WD40 repeat protein